MSAPAHRVDLNQVTVGREGLLLLRLVRGRTVASGFIRGAHDFEQRDQLHFVVGIQDLNPRLVDFEILELHDERCVGFRFMFRFDERGGFSLARTL
jgi:hypothetical protein